jgi:MraZ protein
MGRSVKKWGIRAIASGQMFFGEFEYKVDDKGRGPVPPRFREDLRGSLVLTPGPEKCINAYPTSEWKKLADSFTGSGPMAPSKLRRLTRALFATAFTMDVDAQGRVALPAVLREYAGIKGEVVIAGVNAYLEIWSRDRWDAEKESVQGQFWQDIESLERR